MDPEMSSREFLDWAYNKGIEIEYIQPGKPIQNAYIESFNSRLREECLNEHAFRDLEHAQKDRAVATILQRRTPTLSFRYADSGGV